jgi:hypothetical protein
MRFGFVGGSYTVQSGAVADEECINLYGETNESGGPFDTASAYSGREYVNIKSYFGTPGLTLFNAFAQSPVRGQLWTGAQLFVVSGGQLWVYNSLTSSTLIGAVASDGLPASMAFNGIQVLIVTGGHAYCYTVATAALLEVTAQLTAVPMQCDYSDTYFIVCFRNSNKYQMSQVLDGTTWPGQLVNAVSVFAENIVGIKCNHRELWVFGQSRSQPYQNTGTAEVFDPISGALVETGCAATFSPSRVDNSIFWIGQDERGATIAWRSNGYTPQRISTHAVELWLSNLSNLSALVSYSYQDRGHIFWVLYVPGSDTNWVFDVGENMWHKRASWVQGAFKSHNSWNHSYAFGKHLVGDWATGNLYQLDFSNYTDNGNTIRRLRRSPTIGNEMAWVYHSELTVDFDPGVGPQPPLLDGNNAPRSPQAILRWSDNRGKTWSNEHIANIGMAGQYNQRVIWRRLGRSRYRVYEMVVTDPIPVAIVDAYLTAQGLAQ